MARKRMISPEFWTDDKVIELSIQERLLFIAMWNFADDEGLIANKPKQMKAQIFPIDDITHGAISEMLMSIHNVGLIQFGNDNTLIKIKNWTRHQKINRPTPSNYKFTKVITESSMSTQETLTTSIVEDSGIEDKGKEKNISPKPIKPKTKRLVPYSARVDAFYKELSQDQDYLEQLKEAYPNVDIPGQIAASKMWLLSNTHKAKKNFKRFVNTWMSNQMEYNKSKPGNIIDVDKEEERIERERLAFTRKMEKAEKEAATDEDRMEALKDWRKNKRKEAHDKDTRNNDQPLKGALDNVLKGFSNG